MLTETNSKLDSQNSNENQQILNLEEVGRVYPIVSKLLTHKWTQSSCLLLVLLAIEGKLWNKITKKACQELLKSSPNVAIRHLQWIIDFKDWTIIWDEPRLEEEIIEDKFSWKYWKKFNSSYKSFWHLLVASATAKRYDKEEYFDRLIAEVRKDDWWKNVITEEMVLRKFEFLDNKFWKLINKKAWTLSEITHIF